MIYIQQVSAAATVEGSIWRRVRCTHCGTSYIFRVSVTIQHSDLGFLKAGRPDLRERAKKTARSHLNYQFKRKILPVPCPSCYHYQHNMCEELRKRRYAWIYTPAMFLLTFGGAGMMCAVLGATSKPPPNLDAIGIFAAIGLGGIGLGVGAFTLRRVLWDRYNPNTQVSADQRMAIALQEAMTDAEFASWHPGATAVETK
jgi:hypothetical protein